MTVYTLKEKRNNFNRQQMNWLKIVSRTQPNPDIFKNDFINALQGCYTVEFVKVYNIYS